MKKISMTIAATIVASMMATPLFAEDNSKETEADDSLRLERLQEVVINGVRGQKDAPFTTANIKKTSLRKLISKNICIVNA